MSLRLRFLVALVPLGTTPILGWVLGEGYLDLGGGDKDIFVAIPWMIWSLFFGVSFLVVTRRPLSLSRSVLGAAGWATGLIILLWLALYVATFV